MTDVPAASPMASPRAPLLSGYEFDVPPFPTLYQRLNDLTNPSNTDEIRDLVARDILAGTFIGNDFSRQFAIDDCCEQFPHHRHGNR